MTFKLTIWYAASPEDAPAVHEGLSAYQLETGLGAFGRDLAHLEGQGVRKMIAEVES